MKQSEEAIGPKVDFQLTLGSLTMFLSPRQFHVLLELVNGLTSPHLEDNRFIFLFLLYLFYAIECLYIFFILVTFPCGLICIWNPNPCKSVISIGWKLN